MANKINFITGETYTLAELFSGERRIIIPDLQRDYCWGDSSHAGDNRELVTNFIDNLIQQYNSVRNNKLNLGLIYGYEGPANHIQLCDGQQRITTLYLLIGMINRHSSDNRFQHHLISDFEYKHDDKEPYLQYAIRESSLYFLSDLVCRFFIKDGSNKIDKVADISTQGNSWYFEDYKIDPSVQSMLRALLIIEEKLAKEEKENSLHITDLGDYLVEKLTFMYYDMGNRRNGEETFVVINTTGEPLTATQNLKPLIISAKINETCADIAKRWEKIETWFWENRKNDNDTADAGFEEFLRWITIIELTKANNDKKIEEILSSETYSFLVDEISFDKIYSYWESVKNIFSKNSFYSSDLLSPKLNNKKRILSQIECFTLLPVITYVDKFREEKSLDVEHVYQFFKNISRYQNISIDNKSIYNAINTMLLLPNKEITSLVETDKISKHILTNEEECKLKILKDNPRREKIEKAFWEVQSRKDIPCHKIWEGQISPLIEWSMVDGEFHFERFKQYTTLFDKVFKGQCDGNIDITRKALLTQNLKGYPRIFKGNTNWSFGWDWEEWSILIRENKVQFKAFFNILLAAEDMDAAQQIMIDNFKERSQWWSVFVEPNGCLEYCGYKHVQLVSNDIIRLMSKGKASADYRYLYGWQEVQKHNNWEGWRNYGSNCLYADHMTYDIAIDLLVEPRNPPEKRFGLKIFNRLNGKKSPCDLTDIASRFSLKLGENNRHISDYMTSKECYELCEKIRAELSYSEAK